MEEKRGIGGSCTCSSDSQQYFKPHLLVITSKKGVKGKEGKREGSRGEGQEWGDKRL